MEKQNLLLYRVKGCYNQEPWQTLGKLYALFFTGDLDNAVSYLTNERIACIVTEFSSTYPPHSANFATFDRAFKRFLLLFMGLSTLLKHFKKIGLLGQFVS